MLTPEVFEEVKRQLNRLYSDLDDLDRGYEMALEACTVEEWSSARNSTRSEIDRLLGLMSDEQYDQFFST